MKDRLHEMLDYKNGKLIWMVRASTRIKVGDSAGYLNPDEMVHVRVDGAAYYRNRLVWIFHHGDIPEGLQVDHIDRNKSNDKIENLRLATCSQNRHNLKAKGYHWNKPLGKWQAKVCHQGKDIHLGYYDCQIDARAEYLRAKRKLAGEFAPV